MSIYNYDLHIHSCLSPCGDEDNTPNNICGMAALSEIDIVALTDHNSSKNCPAFFSAAEKYGIIPIAGMELTTAEDIHVVCLFENLSDALLFDEFVQKNQEVKPYAVLKELLGHTPLEVFCGMILGIIVSYIVHYFREIVAFFA